MKVVPAAQLRRRGVISGGTEQGSEKIVRPHHDIEVEPDWGCTLCTLVFNLYCVTPLPLRGIFENYIREQN